MVDVDDVLAHYGTRGMKWGVRRAEKRAAKADKKWQKNIYSLQGAIAVHNASADFFNQRIGAFNDAHPNASIWDHPDTPASKAYLRGMEKLEERSAIHAVTSVHGDSPSGKLRASYKVIDGQPQVVVDKVDAEHAADFETLVFHLDLTPDGKVSSARYVKDELEQSSLEHYGVKGMKWGKRNAGGSSVERTKYSKAPSKLSNEELARRISRMETEQKYNKLNRRDVSEGEKLVTDVLMSTGRTVAKTALTGASLLAIKVALDAKLGEGVGQEVARRLK